MEPWLELCRGAAADVAQVLRDLPTRAEREPVVGPGVGGDDTTAVDAAAEAAIVARLEALHDASGLEFTLVSEELGERSFGTPGARLRLVVDPIDGSNNAKRGLPFFSFSFAAAEGPAMRDVVYGYVFDFGTGEEWTVERGGPACLDGARLGDVRPKDEIELLAFEATTTAAVADQAAAMVGIAHRLRVMGSLALSLCHLAAGRLDAVCSLKRVRAVDIAAAQLLVRECGLAIDLPDAPPFLSAPLDTGSHSRVVAAGGEEACARIYAALRA